MTYGVNGNTIGFGSVIQGSSPCESSNGNEISTKSNHS